jgi:hypothetical protein
VGYLSKEALDDLAKGRAELQPALRKLKAAYITSAGPTPMHRRRSTRSMGSAAACRLWCTWPTPCSSCSLRISIRSRRW